MINERSSAQSNTPTSANMQYGYPPNHFEMMNMPTMQNPNDLYSYYPPSLYQPFGPFDDHNQWGSADTSGNVAAPPPPGPMQFHPSMYTPSPLDIPRSPFDYPPPHAFPHYHPGFNPSTFQGPPSAGTSAFDMSWNPHSLSMQQMSVVPQQMTPIGGGQTTNKKISVYDDYPSGGVGDMLAQHMSAVDLGTNASNNDAHNYDNGTNDNSANLNALSSKEQQQQQQQQQQQHYQSNSSNLSLSSRPNQAHQSSVPSGPKSYASVVSADTLNNNNAPSSVSNVPLRTTGQSTQNERNNTNINNNNPSSNFSNDSYNSRSNTNFRGANNNNNNPNTNNYSQQPRNGSSGYNSRNQQQPQQQSSYGSGGGSLNWTNNSFPSNSRTGNNNNNTSSTYYNSGSSNHYDRSSYSQQQQQLNSASNNNNKRQNPNYQQNYSSSRTANNMSNGNANTNANPSAVGQQQPMSAANQELLESLKRTHQYNPKDFVLNPKGARFFVIKSYSEDDVHRSIKYNIWCSTEHGNKRLDDAFREREGKGPIYLFFSVNASGHFCGMAEMMSPLDYEHKTDVWQMSNKWQGKFEVKWIYVKDVPNLQFRNIRLENNDNKPVTNSRDTQEIPYEKGKLMLKTMHMYRDKTSIFDDFQYYESKQAEEAANLSMDDNNTSAAPSNKKNSNNDFNNNNNNYSRGNNPPKRQYSANKTSTNSSEQQQQQQIENTEDDDNN